MSHFDTYDFIKNLEKSGIPESQAKAICDGLKECHDASDHVSKADMDCLESRLERKISDTAHRQTKRKMHAPCYHERNHKSPNQNEVDIS